MEQQLIDSGYFDDPDDEIAFAERNQSIPTEEIRKDIQDTLDEIHELERHVRCRQEALAHTKQGIIDRVRLLGRLQRLLELRDVQR